ncbi:MAG: FkbM family methyltransferase [Clostridia bacterium]|nr:FkbM family methyltransferase [Clostridia bacterium]
MQENKLILPEGEDIWTTLSKEERPLVVYGMGNGADKLFDKLAKIGKTPAAVFASDGFVRGQSFRGYRVQSLAEIEATYPDFVILVSFATRLSKVMEQIFSLAKRHPLYLPDMPVVGKTYFTREFMEAHACELAAVYERLADNLSRRIFSAVLSYKLTADVFYLKEAYSTANEENFCFADRTVRTAIDGGAYSGDTAREMLESFPEIVRIIAVEPDPKTFIRLQKFAADHKNVHPIQAALWNEVGDAEFSSGGNRNSSLVGASYEHREIITPLVSVDMLAGEKIDYIKYDVEGAEREALLGSRETILRDRPALGISLYHRSEDLFALPLLLDSIRSDYTFYLRRRNCLPAWEIMLYAV